MSSLIKDPITNTWKYKDANQVTNETTGQTAGNTTGANYRGSTQVGNATQQANVQKALANINAGRPQDYGINTGSSSGGSSRSSSSSSSNNGAISATTFTGGNTTPYNVPAPIPETNVVVPEILTNTGTGTNATTSDTNVDTTKQDKLESEVEEIIEGFKTSSDALTNEASDRFKAEEEHKLALHTQTMNDFQAQLNSLKAEENLIPISLQNEFAGRGATEGGVLSHQKARQRSNAIEQLRIATRLEASRGNVQNAQWMVDRAMSAKYDPIRADRDSYLAQLEAMYPLLTREDQKVADARKEEKEEEKAILDAMQEEETAIWNIGVNATPILSQLENGSSLIQEIFDAETEQEAFMIAEANGVFLPNSPSNTFTVRNDANGNLVQIEQTPEGQVIGQPKVISYKALDPEDGEDDGVTDYSKNKAKRTIASVTELHELVNRTTVGIGGVASSYIPETPAYNFKAKLSVLKSNIAFGELTQMREASKTGGALGQVSERELNLLQNALGALNQGQSPEAFKAELMKIKNSIETWQKAVGDYQASQGKSTIAPDGEEIIITD